MRDLDFLTDRPAFAGTLIYRYRTGILRPQVRAALAEIASGEGNELAGCERDELVTILRGGSLLTPVYLCDWTRLAPSSVFIKYLDEILAGIVAMAGDRFALFVPFESPLSMRPLWHEVEQAAGLVLVEEPVTRETLMPALRLFQTASDLAKGVDWLADLTFVASFSLFRGRRRRTLLELRHALDDRVATSVDPITQAFQPEVYRDLHPDQTRSRGASALRHLRQLLERRRGWDRFDLVRVLDERHTQDGWTSRAVVGELHRVTAAILEEPADPAGLGEKGHLEAADLVLWTALLLSWDTRLHAIVAADADGYRRRPDGLVTALDELGRDFLARADLGTEADPLAGAWAGLEDALKRMATNPDDTLAPVRTATVEALNWRLRRIRTAIPWLLRIRRRVRRAIDEAKAAEAKRRLAEIEEERAAQDAETEAARFHAEQAAIAQALAGTKGRR